MLHITEFTATNVKTDCLRRIADTQELLQKLQARLVWAQTRLEVERISKLDFIQFAAIYVRK